MNVTHTRISTLQGSSRGHYNWTLQLALFDKKRRKGNHCILLYSLFFLNPLDSGFRWNWRVISSSSVPTLYPFIRIRRTLIAFPPTTNVLPSCIPASFLFGPIIFHPTNLLFWKMITVHRGILLSTIHSYSDMYPTYYMHTIFLIPKKNLNWIRYQFYMVVFEMYSEFLYRWQILVPSCVCFLLQ